MVIFSFCLSIFILEMCLYRYFKIKSFKFNLMFHTNTKKILFLTVVFIFAFIPCPAQDASGRVKGIVTDWQNARVLATTITFQSKQFQKTVIVNPEGEYEIDLPTGFYTVTTERFGYRKYKLRKLKILPNQFEVLNIKLKYAATKSFKCPAGVPCL